MIHGIYTWIAWVLFGFTLVGTNRWFAYRWRYNQIIHTVSGSIVTCATLFSITTVMELGEIKIHPHMLGGFVFIFAAPIVSAGGFLAIYMR